MLSIIEIFLLGPPYIIERVPLIAPTSPPLTGASKKEILFEINFLFDEIFWISCREVVE